MKDKIVVFDTTLRDGEQCPGASMNPRQKLEVARQLARLGVDVIEAGFPVSSKGDFQSVNIIARKVKGPVICALARCVDKDIDAAGAAIAPAGKKGRIHVFVGTSPEHRANLGKTRQEVLEMAGRAVRRAFKYTRDVEFSAMDATRTERDFLKEICDTAVKAGATTINIPDTVGVMMPDEMEELVGDLQRSIPLRSAPEFGNQKVHLSVHCHNDLGLATANSLAAVRAGADQVECALNGIGERAGNAALEEVVMAIKTKRGSFGGYELGINTSEILRSSRLVARMSGLQVQRSKAIVGENAFSHASGIHQDGMLKRRQAFEIMDPKSVGWGGTSLPLTKHSGRAAVVARLKHLGFQMSETDINAIFDRFKAIGDGKKFVYDDDLTALVEQYIGEVPEVWSITYVHAETGTGAVPTATVILTKHNGSTPEIHRDAGLGDGVVDAVFKTIDRLTKVRGRLQDYSVRAVTKGKDALAQVQVEVKFGKRVVKGKGADTDTVQASARAYVNALNRFLQNGNGHKVVGK